VNILFIARHFPPDGGGGVQRTVKFCKYLPEFGVYPTVLTANDPRTSRYVPEDLSMCREVDPGTEVVRVSYKGSRPRVSERVQAILEAGRKRIRSRPPDLIFVTASPFEDLTVARALSAETSIPWVADLRDPWVLDEFQVSKSRWHRLAEMAGMRRVLESASLIIMNTPEAAHRLRRLLRSQGRPRVAWIPNGYDAEDFVGPIRRCEDRRFSIVHTGALHSEKGFRQARRRHLYRLLGKVQPGTDLLARSHVFLIRAIERWIEEEPDRRTDVALHFVGVATEKDKEVVKNSTALSMVNFHGYMPHTESLRLLRAADLLFLPLHQVGFGRRASIVPGKTYEYMASGKPVLAAVPNGDAKEFLTLAKCGPIVAPDDVAGILKGLREVRASWLNGVSEPPDRDRGFISRFERKRLSCRLAEELHILLGQEKVCHHPVYSKNKIKNCEKLHD
jgi:glycosyltransferase involved in cell wall biosynthesis